MNYWGSHTEIYRNESALYNSNIAAKKIIEYNDNINSIYDEWSNRELIRVKSQVEAPGYNSNNDVTYGRERFGIFGQEGYNIDIDGEGNELRDEEDSNDNGNKSKFSNENNSRRNDNYDEYKNEHDNSNNSEYNDDYNDDYNDNNTNENENYGALNEVHVFTPNPNTDYENLNITTINLKSDILRNKELYSALQYDCKEYSSAIERMCQIREIHERDIYQIKQVCVSEC